MYIMYPLYQQNVTQCAIVILSNNMVYIWPLFHMLQKLLLYTQVENNMHLCIIFCWIMNCKTPIKADLVY